MGADSTTRFSTRVDDYVRYRPDYPAETFDLLRLDKDSVVADVGAGTGISTRRLLHTGATVYAVEPNAPMRAAEAALGRNPRFHGIDGTADATGLPDDSVDLVAAFQAFHWFDRAAARREFVRILRPGGQVALVWNERIEEGSPFLVGYEALLREFAGDYLAVRHNAIQEEDLAAWFGGGMKTAAFENAQRFDYEGTEGRLMSSSYAPPPGDPRHAPMIASLRRLFDATAEEGTVEFRYETRVFYGPLA